MIYTALDNFYLDDDALENSPSRKDGIDRDTETTLRIYGTELIQEAGILLKYPQAVMATGQVLFHRFYCKRSMKEFNVRKLAATALWLAAKLEEIPMVSTHKPADHLQQVLVVLDRVCARRESTKFTVLNVHGEEFNGFKAACIKYEREMLKVFGFVTHVEHPHKMMLNYCQILGLDNEEHFPGLLQEAWSLLNDSLRTTLCVRYRSRVVACGIIFLAARRKQVPLPEDPPWWQLFDVDPVTMAEVCREMHALYSRPQAQHVPVFRNPLASKPGTPASPGTQQQRRDGDTVDRLDPNGLVGTPVGSQRERANSQAPAGNQQQQQASSPAEAPASSTSPPGSNRKRSRSPAGGLRAPAAVRKPRWEPAPAEPAAADPAVAGRDGSAGQAVADELAQAQAQAQQEALKADHTRKERPRSLSRSRSRDRQHRSSSHRDRDRDRDKGRERDKDRSKDHDRDRERSSRRDRDRDRSRERSDRRQHRSRSRDRRDRSRSRGRKERPRQRSRSRDGHHDRSSQPLHQRSSSGDRFRQPDRKEGPEGGARSGRRAGDGPPGYGEPASGHSKLPPAQTQQRPGAPRSPSGDKRQPASREGLAATGNGSGIAAGSYPPPPSADDPVAKAEQQQQEQQQQQPPLPSAEHPAAETGRGAAPAAHGEQHAGELSDAAAAAASSKHPRIPAPKDKGVSTPKAAGDAGANGGGPEPGGGPVQGSGQGSDEA